MMGGATSSPGAVCRIDTVSGEVLEEGRNPTSPEAFERRFSGCERRYRCGIGADNQQSRTIEHPVSALQLGAPHPY